MIITTGRMTKPAIEAVGLLLEKGISACVVTLPTVHPLPDELSSILSNAKRVVTVEDHSISGGIGSKIGALIAELGYEINFSPLAYPNEPIVHGKVCELDEKYGLDAKSICNRFIK